ALRERRGQVALVVGEAEVGEAPAAAEGAAAAAAEDIEAVVAAPADELHPRGAAAVVARGREADDVPVFAGGHDPAGALDGAADAEAADVDRRAARVVSPVRTLAAVGRYGVGVEPAAVAGRDDAAAAQADLARVGQRAAEAA